MQHLGHQIKRICRYSAVGTQLHQGRVSYSTARQRKAGVSNSNALLLLFIPVSAAPAIHRDAAVQAGAEQATTSGQLSGTWTRDDAASELEAYDRMLGLMQLNGLQRTTALRLIEGVEVDDFGTGLRIKFLTVVPFFQVTEEVRFGVETTQARRDLRPGTQSARAARTAAGAYVEMRWADPVGGRLLETYHVNGDTLFIQSSIDIAGRSETTTVVYRRTTKWRPRFKFPGS